MFAGKDFYTKFKWIKAEVLALKQAHEYGLNRTDFDSLFIEEAQSSRVIDYVLTITVETNSIVQPYIDLSSIDLFSFSSWVWDADTKTFTIYGSYMNSLPSQVGYKTAISLISTKPIVGYTWEEIND